jgi:pre-mRNA-splicing helicase BRR2
MLLGFDLFEFIKILRQNRQMIYYCTKLCQAQPEEKVVIEKEMGSVPELQGILNQLGEVKSEDIVTVIIQISLAWFFYYQYFQTEREKRDKSTQQRRLIEAGGEAVAAASWSQSRKILDLDDLAFSQGSHLMSNKKCILPEGSQRTQKKSYESIQVPALKPKPFESDEVLFSPMFCCCFTSLVHF